MSLIPLAQGVPVRTIGNHRLMGSLVDLKKPLAVVQKQRGDSTEHAKKSRRLDDHDSTPAYSIAGLVRKKVIFQQRPVHIINTRARRW